MGETRKREAEAAVQEAQNRALAKAALAQAERVEAERRAAVEAPAKAEKARVIVEAQAEAERRRIDAEAQAAATFARLDAEARGQFEILAKKGDGLRRIIEACGGSQQAFQLLMLEHLDNLAQTAATAISNIKFDKVIVWDNAGNGAGTSNTSNFLQSMARTLPPMLQIMKDIGGVEMPEYLAKLTTDAKGAEKTAPENKVPEAVSERLAASTNISRAPLCGRLSRRTSWPCRYVAGVETIRSSFTLGGRWGAGAVRGRNCRYVSDGAPGMV